MRRAVSVFLMLFVFLIVALPSASSQDVRDLPDLPGIPGVAATFHSYNVNGPFAGRFHCLVTEHNLDPAVLVFVRGVEGRLDPKDPRKHDLRIVATPQLKDLLVKLDTVADKNPAVRLETYVIFYGDKSLPNVVLMDDERDILEVSLKKLADDLKLKHTILTLASRSLPEEPKDPDPKLKKAVPLGKQYNLADDNETTVILYKRYRLYGRHDLGAGKLDQDKVDQIVGEVRKKFGAERE
jgi:hypothetical protein